MFSPFKPVPELWGHMGTTGAFAYFCPVCNACIAGTINQVHNPGLPYKLIAKLLTAI
jgi:D-alanyl-D-alanine carboxypeptidase